MKKKIQIPEKHSNRLFPVVLDLLSKKDFYQVDVRSISRTSGVSIGTIYKFYSSKEDLLFSILSDKLQEIELRINSHIQGLQSFKDVFRKILWTTMDFYDQNPGTAITAFITVPTRTWMQDQSFKIKKDVFISTLAAAKKRGEVNQNIDIRRFLDIYFMICYRCIHSWYYFGKKWKLVEAVEKDFELYWKMLAPPN
jgi:AcrR family transcriptional regulator